jgi:hypothetical protein
MYPYLKQYLSSLCHIPKTLSIQSNLHTYMPIMIDYPHHFISVYIVDTIHSRCSNTQMTVTNHYLVNDVVFDDEFL